MEEQKENQKRVQRRTKKATEEALDAEDAKDEYVKVEDLDDKERENVTRHEATEEAHTAPEDDRKSQRCGQGESAVGLACRYIRHDGASAQESWTYF